MDAALTVPLSTSSGSTLKQKMQVLEQRRIELEYKVREADAHSSVAARAKAAQAAQTVAWAEAARAKLENSEGEDKSWAESCEDSDAQAWAVPHHKGAPWDSWAVHGANHEGTPSYGRPY